MSQIVFIVLLCSVLIIHQCRSKISEEDQKTGEALFDIIKTAMNRSLVPEEEVDDFLDANGVTDEIIEKVTDTSTKYCKEEVEDLLETYIAENLVECLKTTNENTGKLNEMTAQLNKMDIDTAKNTENLREKNAMNEIMLNSLRQMNSALDGSMEETIEDLEKKVVKSAARLTKMVEEYDSSTAKFREKERLLKEGNEKHKERCEHLAQLGSDLRVMLAKWPGEDASFMDKGLHTMKIKYLLQRYKEITEESLKVQEELLAQVNSEQLRSDDSDGRLDIDVMPDTISNVMPDSDVMSESDPGDIIPEKDEL